MSKKFVCLTAAVLAFALVGSAGAQPLGQGKVLFEYWFGGGVDNNLDNLKANANFPDNPAQSEWRDGLDRPDWADKDYWGARGRAFLTPPETGDYTFWTASDDDSELWLSTDADPANAVMIASVEGWCNYQNWTGSGQAPGPNRQSAPIPLVAGQTYYIELLFSDGTGGGHASVAWAGPGVGEAPTVLKGDVLTALIRDPEPLFKAQSPQPADGAVDITEPLFAWTPGISAVMHDIYFGTNPEPGPAEYRGPMPIAMYFHVEPLVPGATYYWRIDEIDAVGVKTEGDVWSFTVMPLEASEPSPRDGAINAPLTPTISWSIGQNAVEHDVYLSANLAAVEAGDASILVGSVSEAHFHVPALEPETTYYWRVDEVDVLGVTTPGVVWSFSTVPVIEPVDDPNLVGWWTFDTEPQDSLVALDMSGNGHHGVLQGAIAFQEVLGMGQSLKLPGGDNQFVDVGPVGISGNDVTTIACWAKADNTSIPDWTLIFGFTGTEAGAGGNGSHFNIGSLGGPGGVGAHCWGWEETIFTDQEALEWHHYAMTYDGTTITYYGDGVEMDTDEAKSNVRDLAIRGDRVHIGSRITQASSFPGLVDDCRVYDRVLTADEIAELALRPANIVFVSFHGADDAPSAAAAGVGFTEASDIGYTDLLEGAGYNVIRYVTTNNPDAEFLNQADLVIISRAVSSGGYQNDGATRWNSKITAPMMVLGGYVLRSSRMGYTTGTDMPDTTGDIRLTVTDPTHPIFAGVALTDGTMDNPYAGGAVVLPTDGVTVSRGISINNNPADDEGTVLAMVAEASAATGPVGGMVIAEWPAGATLTHSGGAGTDVLAGPRLVFLTGSREPSGVTGGDAAGLFDLYDDGVTMFLNAVDYMLNPPPPPPPEPGTNLLVNGGFENGTSEGWGGYGDNTREVVTDDPIEGDYCMHVVVNSAGANFWDGGVQTFQGQVFEAGKQYTFSVWLKCASGTRKINLKPELAADPWTGYGSQEVTMTDTWTEYHVTTPVFAADVTPTSITMHIQYEAGEFWIDDARFYEGEYVAP